ncbi:hypothetical protein LR68_01073 [Anoxybacillus sp. BCO1]|nr:hypothetical protein LR68_01073 [Anoxybacillus sp. BCO1]
MRKREVPASVKDERLVKKRRNQMIKGQFRYLNKKGFIKRRRAKLPALLALASERYTNTFAKRKTFFI